jgi:hypothetical protein
LDQREVYNKDGNECLLWIPGWPYETWEYCCPDYFYLGGDPAVTFPKALIADLQASGVFADVAYVDSGGLPTGDITVSGVIESTRYVEKKTLHGLSILWYGLLFSLTLPFEYVTHTIALSVDVVAKDGAVLLRRRYVETDHSATGFFYSKAKWTAYVALLRRINEDIVLSLEQSITHSSSWRR